MISSSVVGIIMMMAAVIVDASPQQSVQALGMEWKEPPHLIGFVFWFGFVIFLFGGGSATHEVIVKHRHEGSRGYRFD
jgi:hypothetical protein